MVEVNQAHDTLNKNDNIARTVVLKAIRSEDPIIMADMGTESKGQ
jgi:hypothetical protein